MKFTESLLLGILHTTKVHEYQGGEPEPAETILVDKLQRFPDPLGTLRLLMDANPERIIIRELGLSMGRQVGMAYEGERLLFVNVDEFRAVLRGRYDLEATLNAEVEPVPMARIEGATLILRRA